MNHNLKTVRPYIDDVRSGIKPFEVRKDDRNYQVGDTLTLQSYENGEYLKDDPFTVIITYILGRTDNERIFVRDGYVILGIKSLLRSIDNGEFETGGEQISR